MGEHPKETGDLDVLNDSPTCPTSLLLFPPHLPQPLEPFPTFMYLGRSQNMKRPNPVWSQAFPPHHQPWLKLSNEGLKIMYVNQLQAIFWHC